MTSAPGTLFLVPETSIDNIISNLNGNGKLNRSLLEDLYLDAEKRNYMALTEAVQFLRENKEVDYSRPAIGNALRQQCCRLMITKRRHLIHESEVEKTGTALESKVKFAQPKGKRRLSVDKDTRLKSLYSKSNDHMDNDLKAKVRTALEDYGVLTEEQIGLLLTAAYEKVVIGKTIDCFSLSQFLMHNYILLPDRTHYFSREIMQKSLEACPDMNFNSFRNLLTGYKSVKITDRTHLYEKSVIDDIIYIIKNPNNG